MKILFHAVFAAFIVSYNDFTVHSEPIHQEKEAFACTKAAVIFMNNEINQSSNALIQPKKNESDTAAAVLSREKSGKRLSKPFAFYCVMTFSVMLLILAFAATELFALFFSEGYIGGSFISKIFGSDGASEKSFGEIMLSQSFSDLSYWKSKDSFEDYLKPTNPDNIKDPPLHGNVGNTEKLPETSNGVLTDDKIEEKINIYDYDPSGIPSGMSGIMPMDLSLSEYGIDYIHNQSSADIDWERVKETSVSFDTTEVYPFGSPLVLIVHTHGTEAFSPDGIGYYDPSNEVARSEDVSRNTVGLGCAMAKILNELGVPTVHCEVMHDAEGYTGSYSRSAESIKQYLAKYPSIQYVIDVHRDAIVRSGGELVKPIASVKEGTSAQIMCVIGTGISAGETSSWESNLALAQKLREKLNGEAENLCRPTCLRDSSYNQQYSTYSVLLEIGAAGNTYSEALLAAKTAARNLAAVIKGE